jgi:hypothetical protein
VDSGGGWIFEAPRLDLLQSRVVVVVPLVAVIVSSLAVPSRSSSQVVVLSKHFCTSLGNLHPLLSWHVEAHLQMIEDLLPFSAWLLFSPCDP